MEPLTAGEVGDLFAGLEPTIPAGFFSRQFRTMVQRGLVQPVRYRGVGRTAAALFDEHRICRARIISVLQRFGLQPEQIRSLTKYLNYAWHSGDDLLLASQEFAEGFAAYINLIRKGERLFFVVKMTSDRHDEDTQLGDLFGGFTRNPKFGPGEFRVLGTIVLDALDLLGPLLQRLDQIATDQGGRPQQQNGEFSAGDGSEAATPQRSRRPIPAAEGGGPADLPPAGDGEGVP
jgi:hypothetical protein